MRVLGFYGHHNCGDESYKLSFPLLFPDAKFNFSDTNNEDACILGGGNVISPYFLEQLNIAKKKIILSVSFVDTDPVESLRNIDQICVRDYHSLRILEKAGIKASYFPDFAFALTPNPDNGKQLISKLYDGRDLYDKVVVIVINGHLAMDENWLARDHFNFEKVIYDLTRTIDNTKASFLFVPFSILSPADDRVTNGWLSSRCKFWQKNVVVYNELPPQQILDIISASNAVISTRLHASIFACVAGIPFLDITHHDKNLHFLETIYRQDWSIPYWRFDHQKFATLLKEFLFTQQDEFKSIADKNRLILGEIKNDVCLA